MTTGKLHEIWEELRMVFSARGSLIDAILPSVIFLLANAVFDLRVALGSSLVVALGITGYRLLRRRPLRYALGGIGAVVIAILVALLLGRAEGYFLPDIISGALTVLACLVSVVVRRPLVAWTSHVTRRWPLAWYWHPQVRPAYSEVTLAWAVYFALRLLLQWSLFREEPAGLLGVIQLLIGWPATIILLVLSYLYGTWRLGNLVGPSVEEFRTDAPAPWAGQRRGF